ncbi:MAG TPA: BON domain-containing protein [bacterium]
MAEQYVSDPKDVELEAAISRTIRNMGASLHVSVKHGHATISGMADDFSDKRSIINTVRGISGVHEVTDHIRVAPVGN